MINVGFCTQFTSKKSYGLRTIEDNKPLGNTQARRKHFHIEGAKREKVNRGPWFCLREKILQFRVSRLLENTSKLGITFKTKSYTTFFKSTNFRELLFWWGAMPLLPPVAIGLFLCSLHSKNFILIIITHKVSQILWHFRNKQVWCFGKFIAPSSPHRLQTGRGNNNKKHSKGHVF